MFETTRKLLTAAAATLMLLLAVPLANAQTAEGDDPALSAAIARIETEWARIRFGLKEGSDQQLGQMDELGKQADALAEQYPDRPAALTWSGIILSERASLANERNSLTSGLTALRLAKQARAVLEKSYEIDPSALNAAAATTLGVLYYRVPGPPVGFGDKNKARALLEEAVSAAPDSLDTEYFYAEFLYTVKQLPQAEAVLLRARTIPQDDTRPVWDRNRRLAIESLLKKIRAES